MRHRGMKLFSIIFSSDVATALPNVSYIDVGKTDCVNPYREQDEIDILNSLILKASYDASSEIIF